jgi:hypothetical protein
MLMLLILVAKIQIRKVYSHTDRFEHGQILQLSSGAWHFPNGSPVWNYKDFAVTYGSVPDNVFEKKIQPMV